MSSYSKIEKDNSYTTLYTKIEPVTNSDLKSVGDNDKQAFILLENNTVASLNDLTSGGVWSDMTSVTVGNETINGIQNIIDQYEKPIDIVMLTIGGHVEELKRILKYYDDVVDSHNENVEACNNLVEPKRDGFKTNGEVDEDAYTKAHNTWQSNVDSYASRISDLSKKVTESKSHIDKVITTIKGLMSPEGMYTGVEGYNAFNYETFDEIEILPYEAPEIPPEEEIRKLTDEEKAEFIRTHAIREGDDLEIYAVIKIVNGVAVPFYYVTTDQFDRDDDLMRFSDECVKQISKMDGFILSLLISNGTDITLLEDPKISLYNNGNGGYCGLFWPGSNIVHMAFPENGDFEGSAEGLIHELGHGVDWLVGTTEESRTTDCWNLSLMNADNVPPELVELFTQEDGTMIFWDQMIQDECAAMFPCETEEATLQNVENTRNTPSEYIAELFKRYYKSEESRERMKSVAPESYAAIERIIKYLEKKGGH